MRTSVRIAGDRRSAREGGSVWPTEAGVQAETAIGVVDDFEVERWWCEVVVAKESGVCLGAVFIMMWGSVWELRRVAQEWHGCYDRRQGFDVWLPLSSHGSRISGCAWGWF